MPDAPANLLQSDLVAEPLKLGAGVETPIESVVRWGLQQAGAGQVYDALAAGGALRAGDIDKALGSAISLGAGLAPMALGGMTKPVWHGTPHLFAPEEGAPFGRFKSEAIGSGEGAQAYGWGHYVAGNRRVAEDYQQQLAGHSVVPVDERGNPLSSLETARKFYEPGTIVPSFGGNDRVLEFQDLSDSSPEKWQVKVQAVLPREGSAVDNPSYGDMLKNPDAWRDSMVDFRPRIHSTFPEDRNLEMVGNLRGWNMQKPGTLLEVHVLPDEHEFLDWDRGVHEQAPEIQNKLQPILKQIDSTAQERHGISILNEPDQFAGSDVYKLLSSSPFINSQQEASAALHDAGIPGIKYLDAGSRNNPNSPAVIQVMQDSVNNIKKTFDSLPEGHVDKQFVADRLAESKAELNKALDWQPTHNFVVFDPSNLRIVGRNGQRLEPVEGNPFEQGSRVK